MSGARYARVISLGDAGVTVLLPDGAVLLREAGPAVRIGDMVEVSGERVRLAARSDGRDPDTHEWWRLRARIPNLLERSRLTTVVRDWFFTRGFLETQVPVVVDTPGTEVHISAIPVDADSVRKYLSTSPELQMKRLLATGVERLVYIGRSFRDGERGHQHLCEFTMCEWYRAGGTVDSLMADVESLVEAVTGVRRIWVVLTVAEALERWGTPSDDPDVVARELVENVEPAIAGLGAVFLTRWPASMASLARLNEDDPAVCERVEAYVDGVELANGFLELTDHQEQRRRCLADQTARRRAGLPVYPLDEKFLDALACGLPNCAGIALGLDRLFMVAMGLDHIDDLTAFPPEVA